MTRTSKNAVSPTKQQPEGIPNDFPETFVLMDVFHSRGGPFQRLLDCGGIRYVLLLEYKEDEENCFENDLLEKMYEAFVLEEEDIDRCRHSLSLVSEACMKMFWPYLNKDFQMHCTNGTLTATNPLDCDGKDSHKLQLKTIERSVRAIEHDTDLNHCEHFDNLFPDLRLFPKSQAEVLETVYVSVFRVRIKNQEYAIKTGNSYTLPTIEKLHSAPTHPNVLSLSGAVVDKEGRIMGTLTPFIPGPSLSGIPSATISQKEKWKTKISEAMDFLHNESIIWGDAKPENVTISSIIDEPVLIDFDGGYSEGWVDADLCDTLEGDLQALLRLLKFVDDIPTCGV